MNDKSSKRKTKAQRKKEEMALVAEILDYRLQGYGYEQIEETLKQPKARIMELASKGLAALARDDSTNATLIELGRVNQMMTGIYASAAGGDHNAISTVLRLMHERERLENKLVPQSIDGFPTIIAKCGRDGKHVPTQESVNMVRGLAINGVAMERIAKHVGLDRTTLRKHYGNYIENAKDHLLASACAALAENVKKHREASVFFALKTQGRWRETDNPWERSETGEMVPPKLQIEIIGGLSKAAEIAKLPLPPKPGGEKT